MSYCRWSVGYYFVLPEDVTEELKELFPKGMYNPKSDVYCYQSDWGYMLHMRDRRVEHDKEYKTPWELAERLIDLQQKGYAVPYHAVAMLVEDQIELDRRK